MLTTSVWRGKMLELLQRLFELLGGDPKELTELDLAIVQVRVRFDTHGFPEPMSSQAKTTGLDDLSELSMALGSPGNDLTENQNFTLIDLQVDMTQAIINSP